MRCLTYAGQTVVTTDDVASSLVELTAALARRGLAEAVSIPVFHTDTRAPGDAELVIGVGNDVLSVDTEWPEADPDAAAAVDELRQRIERLGGRAAPSPRGPHYDRVLDDPNFDRIDDEHAGHDRADDGAAGAGGRTPIPFRPREPR